MTEQAQDPDSGSAVSGQDLLPEEQRRLLGKAIRVEWISLLGGMVCVVLVASLAGQSQAMKAAWIEDALSLLPPLAFLIATRRLRRPPDARNPWGHHRSIGVAHLVASVALLTMGAFLIIDSTMTLVLVEKPPVGIMVVFGHALWSGWPMIAVLALTGAFPVVMGRIKAKLAEPLHDKVLFADADMNKADWRSALASVVGVIGIGIGWWWTDSVAAILIATSILKDGFTNLRAAIAGLTDARPMNYDDAEPHPLVSEAEHRARQEPWVADAIVRARDEGHVFHAEVFVVPRRDRDAAGDHAPGGAEDCEQLRDAIAGLDWKLHDVVVVPVTHMPRHQAFRTD